MIKEKFITFEGVDGVGKTTLSEKLYDWFLENGKEVVLVKTGFPPIDQAIEKLKKDKNKYDKRAHFLLAISNSLMTFKTQIEPNLADGKIVISDRYFHTTLAYNMALGLDRKWACNVAKIVPRPERIIFCNTDLQTLIRRKNNLYEDIELGFTKTDSKTKAFIEYQSLVRYYYNQVLSEEDDIVTFLDTTASPDETFEKLICSCEERGNQNGSKRRS